MSKEQPTDILVKTGLNTKDGKTLFIAYKVVPTRSGFDFYRNGVCLEDGTRVVYDSGAPKVGGVLEFLKSK